MVPAWYGRNMASFQWSVRRFGVASLVFLGLVAAACGSDSSDASGTSTATTEATATTEVGNGGGTGVAADGDRVAVHYRGTLDDGEVFDSSRERSPLEFVVGTGGVISGFDDAVRGLAVGEAVTVRLPPAEAYGETDPSRVIEFPIEQAPEGIAVGDQVSVGGQRAVVTAVSAETVTVDANHELAGKALTFEIELVSIQ